MTAIDADLIDAYRATAYHVQNGDENFVLQVDRPSAPLRQIYGTKGVSSAAFLTAWNPFSAPASIATNREAQLQLERQIVELGLAHLIGRGEDAAGSWPGEDSVLILGITLVEARRLAETFGQNAFLWCDDDAAPRLVLMR